MARFLLLSLILLCGAAPSEGATELKIYPSEVTLTGAQSTQQLLLVQEENGLVVADRSQGAKWVSTSPTIATVNEQGILSAQADGEALIQTEADGKKAAVKVRVVRTKEVLPPTFRNQVIPILTRAGCNSGACHGALAGKGGLKLSLRGYDIQSDHFVLTREALSRRVDTQDPAQSLLLLKGARQLPHGGGTRTSADSPEYRVLLDWVKAGALPPSAKDAHLERIEILPQAALLRPKDSLRVIVRATYSDGHTEDVSRWARYGSSEEQVATIDEEGVAKVIGSGEAAIFVNFGNHVATMTISVPFPNQVSAEVFAKSPKHNWIDEQILRKLQALRLPPSAQTTDAEFIRRAFLDAAGILPTPAEVSKFVADTSADKRSKLIDELLDRPEFIDYWAYKWSDLFLVSTRKLPQPAMWAFYRSIRQAVADNTPWDRFAREILTVSGSSLNQGGGNFYVLHKDVADLTEATAVTFLGMSITCARCHNHPLEKWTQDQYWSMANLFSRVAMKNGDRPGDVLVSSKPLGDVLHPRHNIAMPPTPLDGKPLDLNSETDRRAHFANWLTSAENPYFAKAMVNRVWKNFMGRGLVEAEDDLRETNPASNRELFDALAKEFITQKYDVKALIRRIMNSAAYQRSSKPITGASGNEGDDRFYSRYLVRRLSGEVLLDVYSQVTGVPTPFTQVYTGVEGGTAATANYPLGTRALQLPDSRVASKFLDQFGRPDRIATCSCERQQDSTVGQALMMNNGQLLNDKLRAKESYIQKWLDTKQGDTEVLSQLFQIALGRQPTATEWKSGRAFLQTAPVDKVQARHEMLEDLFWAVLTTREFIFNH